MNRRIRETVIERFNKKTDSMPPPETFVDGDKQRPCGYWLIKSRELGKPPRRPINTYVNEAIELRDWLYTLPELEQGIKDGLKPLFPKPERPLVVEVGCYFGHTLTELALHNPGINFLGLDIKYKRVVKSCRKLTKYRVTNARVALCEIQDLTVLFPDKSLQGMCIFFPDPWSKNRHSKNRYIREDFFRQVNDKLMDNGFLWLKTDVLAYYNEVKEAACNMGFDIKEALPAQLREREYKTQFESLFIRQNLPIYELFLEKK